MGLGAVVMAAGAGRRMGGRPKSLLLRDGEPLLLRHIRLLAEAGAGDIVVVLGHHAPRLTRVLEQAHPPAGTRVRWVNNPTPDLGPGASLRCALAALPAQLPQVLVTLGDLPLVEAGDVQAVVQAWDRRAPGVELVLPVHDGQPGHPLALGDAVRQAVMQAEGGAGVREWRRAHAEQVQALAVEHARCTTDVDGPGDLQRLREAYGVELTWPEDL